MDTPGKEWAVVIDANRLPLYDLPIEDLDGIAARHNAGSWLDAISGPMQTLAMGKEFVELAAKKLGASMPLIVSGRDLLSVFERIDDDVPGSFTDGIPKGEPDDEATT